MPDAHIIQWVRDKYIQLVPELDERGRRRWAAIEASSLGRGGIAAVAAATGMSDRTIRTGIEELTNPPNISHDRQRRVGGGRKSRIEEQPKLLDALDKLISPGTRGDPTNPLRWTIKSTRTLAQELRKQGYNIGPITIRGLLDKLNYSLQSNRKKQSSNSFWAVESEYSTRFQPQKGHKQWM